MWCPSDLAYTIKKVYNVVHDLVTQLKRCLMWCPSDLAYTIKEYIVWCDVHLTYLAYTIKEYIVWCDDAMSIWPSLHN